MSRFEVDADLINLSDKAQISYLAELDKVAEKIGLSDDPFDRELNSERYFLSFHYCSLKKTWTKQLWIQVNNANNRCIFEWAVHPEDYELASDCLTNLSDYIQEQSHNA